MNDELKLYYYKKNLELYEKKKDEKHIKEYNELIKKLENKIKNKTSN